MLTDINKTGICPWMAEEILILLDFHAERTETSTIFIPV
jgi:hypothetical protein